MIISKIIKLLKLIFKGIKMTIENQRHTTEEEYKTLKLDYPFYVERQADTELFNYLKAGYLCYVFNSRKMGKSSLDTRVRDKLNKQENFKCVWIDLTGIGINYAVKDWYNSLIRNLANGFELALGNNDNFKIWLEERQNETQIDKFKDFLEELLDTISQNILIVFDEIDVFLDAPPESENKFSQRDKNDFFSFIRWCYNNRGNNPNYERLVFCLIGVITPSDLISEPNRTPFNIGHPIELNGFTFEEAAEALIKKLKSNNIPNSDQVLHDILEWTNGQPFLTQRLCDLVIAQQNENFNIDDLEKFINTWKANDNPKYFTRIQEEIVERDEENLGRRLKLYQTIIQMPDFQGIEADNSREQEQLCLSGLVIKTEGKLKVANKIFGKIFDINWVEKALDRLRVYPQELAINWESTEDDSLLLTGQNLQEAIAWKKRMGSTLLEPVDANFIDASQIAEQVAKVISSKETEIELQKVILKMSQKLVGKTTDQENINIASKILEWTNRDFDLFKIICESIDFESAIPEGTEQENVRKWIEKNIINNWENSPLAEKIGTIRNCLLDSGRSLWRLETYQKVLQGESTDTIDSELLTSGLIAQNNDGLRVANRIYASIFNEQWIKDNLPPYAKYFTSGRNPDFNIEERESYLLRGEVLENTLLWIQNKPQLSEPELEFIITSVVWEMWQSNEAVNKVKEFLPQLQEKTQTPAHLVRVIQEILPGTIPQPLLLQAVLQWVCEAEDIPTKNQAKWLKRVARSRIKDCTAQQLAEYLDFNEPSNTRWRELRDENALILIDEFPGKNPPSPEEIEKVKNYKVILDKYQASSHNRHDTESVTNFQRLISYALYRKFNEADDMAGQKEFDQLLDKIVEEAGGDLEAIIIFDLNEGLPLYHNKGLKKRNATLYAALFGEGDDIGGEAFEGFNTLNKMQKAFNKFGEKTEFGEQKSIHVNFANGKMMIYFYQAPDIPTAICFMASKDINLGSINRRANQVITGIKQKLGEQL
jgi:uncharacterized membrane-anchored protein YjiN (DUF445 family)